MQIAFIVKRENRAWCKEKGIRISGLPLGRPPATVSKEKKKQALELNISIARACGLRALIPQALIKCGGLRKPKLSHRDQVLLTKRVFTSFP